MCINILSSKLFFQKLFAGQGLTTEKFLSSVKEGRINAVQDFILSDKSLLGRVGFYGKTALFHAISSRNLRMVEVLLKGGCDVEQMSFVSYHRDRLVSCDESPVVTAARLGEVEMVRRLLEYGAQVDKCSQFHPQHTGCKVADRAALHFACEDGNLPLVELLLKYEADVNIQDKRKELPLHLASRCRSLGTSCEDQTSIVRLLCEHGSEINSTTSVDCTALYLVTFYACLHKARILLFHGADPNKTYNRDFTFGSPLHIAATKDRTAFAELLIGFGAKLDLVNFSGYTPLQLNLNVYSQSQVIWLLIYHGAAVDTIDKHNMTLMAACIRNMRLDCETLARFMVYAGYDLKQDKWLRPQNAQASGGANSGESRPMTEIEIPEGRMTDLCNWLRERQSEPLLLSEICRIQIRKYARCIKEGGSIVSLIQALPLPNAIIEYLLLSNYYTLSLNLTAMKNI